MITAHDLEKLLPEFINHLSSSSSASSTVKNYAADLRRVILQLPGYSYLKSEDYGQALEELSKEFSEASVRRFGFSLKAFLLWLEASGYKTGLETRPQTISKPVSLSPLDSYLSKLKTDGTQETTLRLYLNDLWCFFKWFHPALEKLADLDKAVINRVNTRDINRYISFLRSNNISEASINRYLYSLKGFFGYHKQKVVYDSNPVGNLARKPARGGFWTKFKLQKPRWWNAWRGHLASDYVNWLALASLVLFLGLSFYSKYLVPEAPDLEKLKKGLVLAATPPRILSFQGRLTDSNSVPITATTSIVFRIYTSTSGDTGSPCAATCLWESKTWSVTPDQNGIFSVLLGDTGQADTAIPSTLFSDNAALYLGVKAGADSEMAPRQRIAASTYALNSDSLDGIDSLSFLRSDASDSYTSGTLTTNAGTTLDVNGDVSIADTSIALDGATTDLAVTGDFSINTDDIFVEKATGEIGIGDTSPAALLTVGSGDIFQVSSTGTVTLAAGAARLITFSSGTTAVPSESSTGFKIKLWDGVGADDSYGLGIDGSNFWQMAGAGASFNWYVNAGASGTNLMTLSSTGSLTVTDNLSIGGSTITFS